MISSVILLFYFVLFSVFCKVRFLCFTSIDNHTKTLVYDVEIKEGLLMFSKISEGDVFITDEEKCMVSGSRTAILPDGKLLCVFNTESGAGINDFTPCASYSDDGLIWSDAKPIWPELIGTKSHTAVVRNTENGRISLCGIGFDVGFPGENWWSDELAAMKPNYLTVSVSDDGYHFPLPKFVRPLPGEAAENPGGMLVDEKGVFHIVYSPYPTTADAEKPNLNRMVLMHSTDQGESFTFTETGTLAGPCQFAESWLIRLGNGRRLIGTWQTADAVASDKYLLSDADGNFKEFHDFPFHGQSMALTPLSEDEVIVVYNQRKEANPGVWGARLKCVGDRLEMMENAPIWLSASSTRSNSSGDFTEWTDFSFGEPHALVLPSGKIFTTFWYEEGGRKGIHYVITE